jgi:2-C-methyl-D-erythritol 2,4-cyclodiphosphate synthase
VTTSRVGIGFDVHPFSDDPGRALVLGGIRVEGSPGLAGHSDADVVAHAVADALLGAAGLGDLGTLFPDNDPAWADADSCELLAAVVARVAAEGWTVANVDCSVVTEAPRLAPHKAAMEERLGGIIGAPVSVKPKRAETLGAVGRGEGMACLAVALIERQA